MNEFSRSQPIPLHYTCYVLRLSPILAFSLCICCLSAQENIRRVDFENFSYPLSGNLLGHDRLQWIDSPSHAAREKTLVHLVDGSDLTKTSSFVMEGKEYSQFAGFTLDSVKYADLMGDGKEEAIVVLTYQTGGTQTTNYLYIYRINQNQPKLLAFCHTGDRSDFGLNDVYGKDGMLVFELLDPEKAIGDCCSSGAIISFYKWQDGAFKPAGPQKRRALPPPEVHPDK
jgi:hypothetical protein